MRASVPALVATPTERQHVERLSSSDVLDFALIRETAAALKSSDARAVRNSTGLQDRAAVEEYLRRLLVGPPPDDTSPDLLDAWASFQREWLSEATCEALQEQLAAVEATLDERERRRHKQEVALQTNRERDEALARLADVLDLLAGLPLPSQHEKNE
jgi:hypothetical protein